jgi:hypothetical protein
MCPCAKCDKPGRTGDKPDTRTQLSVSATRERFLSHGKTLLAYPVCGAFRARDAGLVRPMMLTCPMVLVWPAGLAGREPGGGPVIIVVDLPIVPD